MAKKVALRLDTDFLSTVEEEPTFDLDTQDKAESWAHFKEQSYCFYHLMATPNRLLYGIQSLVTTRVTSPLGRPLSSLGTLRLQQLRS